jgi:hypothetical protein
MPFNRQAAVIHVGDFCECSRGKVNISVTAGSACINDFDINVALGSISSDCTETFAVGVGVRTIAHLWGIDSDNHIVAIMEFTATTNINFRMVVGDLSMVVSLLNWGGQSCSNERKERNGFDSYHIERLSGRKEVGSFICRFASW